MMLKRSSAFIEKVTSLAVLCLGLSIGPATAGQVLTLAAPAQIPPYYTRDGGGLIPDIMEGVFGPKGYQIKVLAMGNTRMSKSLQRGRIDIAPFLVNPIPNVFHSVDYLTFLNVAVTKKRRQLKIDSISDLKGLRVAAFQGATSVLGEDYKRVVEKEAALYEEISAQKNQMNIFWRDRVDTVVLGKMIFDYPSFYVKGASHSPDEVTYHYIFGDGTSFSAAFIDKEVRDMFNAGYKEIKASGKLDMIYDKYRK